MRIFVVSDTHGDLKNAIELYDRATENGPVDFIIHCGDFYSDGVRLAQILGQRVFAVHGNCDGGWGEEFKIVETPAGKIIVIHGHNEDVDFSLDNAAWLARREKCAMVCFGHTHKAVIKEHNGILFVNPGSTRRPRSTDGESAAVVTVDESGFSAGIIYLSRLESHLQM
ncbi:MAG: metallophosphoesterase [Firmicutes bacterium]|nr:metallophosphoesterase [Bacillota bacterium]